MGFAGVITISEFCRKYRLNEGAKTELITMQAFHQGIAMLIGAGAACIVIFIIQKAAEFL